MVDRLAPVEFEIVLDGLASTSSTREEIEMRLKYFFPELIEIDINGVGVLISERKDAITVVVEGAVAELVQEGRLDRVRSAWRITPVPDGPYGDINRAHFRQPVPWGRPDDPEDDRRPLSPSMRKRMAAAMGEPDRNPEKEQ